MYRWLFPCSPFLISELQIETSEIDAQISAADIVSFSDPTPQFSRADVDRVLREAQEQGNMLKELEMGLSRSRDYLSKVSFDTLLPWC